jgi:uncharacterized integral membrane protein
MAKMDIDHYFSLDQNGDSTVINFLSSIILTMVFVAIAILSVQNATLVSVGFIGWKSISLPVGLVLTIAGSLGFLFTYLVSYLIKTANF